MTREQGDPLVPSGLDSALLGRLTTRSAAAGAREVAELAQEAVGHLDEIRRAAASNPFVNVRLAEAICDRLQAVASGWRHVPEHARPWLKGAMAYFVQGDDELPDDQSPIGFEDDCEVMNACLRLAGREDLCLAPEDFDEY